MARIRVIPARNQRGDPLAGLRSTIVQIKSVRNKIGKALIKSTKLRFQRQADSRGILWRPLSPAYARQKARQYPGKTILRRTDRLYKSLKFELKGKQSIVLYTNVPYAIYHQEGAPRANLPARPFLGVSLQDRYLIKKIIDRYIKAAQSDIGLPSGKFQSPVDTQTLASAWDI